MSHSDNVHTAESVGSTSSQNRSIKKHTTGKRKRETDTDSSADSRAYSMADPKCPGTADQNFQKVAMAIQMYRVVRTDNQDTLDMAKQSGKYYWDTITGLVNDDEGQVFTRDDVLNMVQSIRAFHEKNYCHCIGVVVSDNIKVRSSPIIPTPYERSSWNAIDRLSNKLIPYNAPSVCQRRKTSFKNKSVVTPNVSNSSMTFERPNKRMCLSNPQPSEVPPLDDMYAPHPEQSGHTLINMMNHYGFSRAMQTYLGAKLLNCPGMIPVICNQFDQEQLLVFLKAVVPEDMYNSWYTEWSARN